MACLCSNCFSQLMEWNFKDLGFFCLVLFFFLVFVKWIAGMNLFHARYRQLQKLLSVLDSTQDFV